MEDSGRNRRRLGWRSMAFTGMCIGMILLVLSAVPAFGMAWEEELPEGSVVTTPTVKPWLVPPSYPMESAATTQPAFTQTPPPMNTPGPVVALTPTPSVTAVATPTPVPTPSPTPPETPILVPEPWVSVQSAETMLPQETQPSLEMPEGQELKVLLVGVDSLQGVEEGRSDAMMVAFIRPQTGQVKLISFLRDLYVKIPGKGSHRLNSAYAWGGAQLLRETLFDNFGIQVDHILCVDFSAVVKLIDKLGGVRISLNEKEMRQLNSILRYYNKQQGIFEEDGLMTAAGEQRMTGKQALSFSRIRMMDSDFQRSLRQHKVLAAVLEQARHLDEDALRDLSVQLFGIVHTDLSVEAILQLLPLLTGKQAIGVEGMNIPVHGGYYEDVVAGMMVLMPNLQKNRDAVEDFLVR